MSQENKENDSTMGEKRGMKALELWCRRVTEGYPGVKIDNMTTSWRDGLAFCALIHHFRPDLIDFDRLDKRDILKNNELAFRIAERQLGIPALLDAEDMVEYEIPDRLSILTYLSQFYQAFGHQGTNSPSPRKHNSSVSDLMTTSPKNTTVKVGRGRVERCTACERPVFIAERLVVGGKLRHRSCFSCARCHHQLNPVSCYETEDGEFVCEMCPDEDKKPEPKPEMEGILPVDFGEDRPDVPVEDIPAKPPDPSKTKFLSDILNADKTDENCTSSDNISGLSTENIECLDEPKVELDNCDSNEAVPIPIEEKTEDLNTKIDEISISETKDEPENEANTSVPEENIPNQAEIVIRVEDVIKDDSSIAESHADLNESTIEVADTTLDTSTDTRMTVTDSEDPSKSNPFGDSDEEQASSPGVCRKVAINEEGKTILEAPKHLNPFWSDSDESEEEKEKPKPAPRTLRTPEPIPRTRFGSSTSLASQSSSVGKKKRQAPQPPTDVQLRHPSSPAPSPSPSSRSSRSPTATRRRKSRPAPPPPINLDKERKDYENKVKQNLSPPADKSTYGKWKRKKGAAPGLPVPPQRRRIIAVPFGDAIQEADDLEIRQSELERQGVQLEQAIRRAEELKEDGQGDNEKDVEEMVLQLFEIVNQKNELFRRQAELMFLRKQQRLEEEHADIEYQIRCLMGRPKNEADPALEEELIRRLVEVVERRNEIIDCLDMNRRRAAEEDQSIHDTLLAFTARETSETSLPVEGSPSPSKKSTKSVLKLIKKKKEKKKDEGDKRKDIDGDIDESVQPDEDAAHKVKSKKKWFKLDK